MSNNVKFFETPCIYQDGAKVMPHLKISSKNKTVNDYGNTYSLTYFLVFSMTLFHLSTSL